jgi:hypothetical protein
VQRASPGVGRKKERKKEMDVAGQVNAGAAAALYSVLIEKTTPTGWQHKTRNATPPGDILSMT